MVDSSNHDDSDDAVELLMAQHRKEKKALKGGRIEIGKAWNANCQLRHGKNLPELMNTTCPSSTVGQAPLEQPEVDTDELDTGFYKQLAVSNKAKKKQVSFPLVLVFQSTFSFNLVSPYFRPFTSVPYARATMSLVCQEISSPVP
ncbi:hypothetical protein COOONC_12983 [Cooperia oncophora]